MVHKAVAIVMVKQDGENIWSLLVKNEEFLKTLTFMEMKIHMSTNLLQKLITGYKNVVFFAY